MKSTASRSLALLIALASSDALAQRSTASQANDPPARCCSSTPTASPEAERRQRIIDQGLENARRYQETGNLINRQLEQLKEDAAGRAEEERRREQARRDAEERRERLT